MYGKLNQVFNVLNCTIRNNQAGLEGGAFYLTYVYNVTVSDTLFENNKVKQ